MAPARLELRRPHVPVKPKACDRDCEPHNIALGQRRVVVGACRGDIGPLCKEDCTTPHYGIKPKATVKGSL